MSDAESPALIQRFGNWEYFPVLYRIWSIITLGAIIVYMIFAINWGAVL